VLAIAAALAALLVAFSGRYGFHRDELYFIEAGRHLAWGYPDQPPFVPLVARLMSDLAPGSLVVLRLPSAVASASLVVLTALTARELGADRSGQTLAAACISVASMTLAAGHLLSTTTFDLPAWALLCLLVVRILRSGDQRLWLAVGLVAGAGLFDTDLVAFLMLAVVTGLLVVGPRRHLTSGWLYAGGAIALALWTPYLIWQAVHGWPELAISRSIANGGSGTSVSRWALLPEQLVLVSPYLAPVWVVGLVRLLRDPAMRWCRAVGVAYLVLAVVFVATGGKTYYLGAMLPVLLAAGAQPAVDWARRGRASARRGLLIAAVLLSLTAIPVTLPVLPVGLLRHTPIVSFNYDAGETIGWPSYVREIADVYASLPASERPFTVVLASNYGEAGAVDLYGPADGLPAVYSGHNAYWYWGPPPVSATEAVAVGFDRSRLLPVCGSLALATHLDNHLGIDNQEQGAPVWVCGRLKSPWKTVWPSLRDFG
jgi:4-amino-4-deoxy-L-arabinose transferase-like glycosyltransferase